MLRAWHTRHPEQKKLKSRGVPKGMCYGAPRWCAKSACHWTCSKAWHAGLKFHRVFQEPSQWACQQAYPRRGIPVLILERGNGREASEWVPKQGVLAKWGAKSVYAGVPLSVYYGMTRQIPCYILFFVHNVNNGCTHRVLYLAYGFRRHNQAGKIKREGAMERPNGRRIVLRFNNKKQPIGDEAGLLSRVLGLLGSNYEKFSIGKESWHKITTKDKVYNECVKQNFHFDEDSEGTIKKYILKSMGRSWKETRLRLYNAFYEPTFTFEQNIEHRPPEIDREHWRKFLEYRTKVETKLI
ncbi:hypothetical protein AHAS_Ahas11G0095900 [Arachis hypogaea]